MKRFLVWIIAMSLLISLSGCMAQNTESKESVAQTTTALESTMPTESAEAYRDFSYDPTDLEDMILTQEAVYNYMTEALVKMANDTYDSLGNSLDANRENLQSFYDNSVNLTAALNEHIYVLSYYYHQRVVEEHADDYLKWHSHMYTYNDQWTGLHNKYYRTFQNRYLGAYFKGMEYIKAQKDTMSEAEYGNRIDSFRQDYAQAWSEIMDTLISERRVMACNYNAMYGFMNNITPMTVNNHQVSQDIQERWDNFKSGKIDIRDIWSEGSADSYAENQDEDRKMMMDPALAEDIKYVLGTAIERSQIDSITFQNDISVDDISTVSEVFWDVSEKQNGNVLAWIINNGDGYDLYIGAKGGVVAPDDCSGLFRGYTNVKRIDFSGNFDTSNVFKMAFMFEHCDIIEHLDLSGFDTSRVTDMSSMFDDCGMLRTPDLSSFDTSAVMDMSYMFNDCENLYSLDLSNFDTSSVRNMHSMFCRAYVFELDLSHFNTSKVANMTNMFGYNYSLGALDVSNFDTSNVMRMVGMFGDCRMLGVQQPVDFSSFSFENAIDVSYMFDRCTSITFEDVKHFQFDPAITQEYNSFMPGTEWEVLFE